MKTLLICHDGAQLDREVMPRWLASFSELTGVVVIREKPGRKWRRIRRQIQRTGIRRFGDVIAFRLYYRIFLAARDRRWEEQKIQELCGTYPALKRETPILYTSSPNSAESEQFIREARPDIVLARCKTLLQERIFSIPPRGTLVMHPGICPEYRNAHGCFWALANDDLEKVGVTLLQIDKGVDTGPVYGYYTYPYDEVRESHIVIQNRVVLENLGALEKKLSEVCEGSAATVDTSGRCSGTWGQPWLSRYLRWKFKARRRAAVPAVSLLYHDVVVNASFAASGFQGADADRYKLDADEFERHLQALAAVAKNGPGSILAYLKDRKPVAPLFITFDDGGASAFDQIARRLEKHGWVGHFLVTADRIGSPGFLTEEEIRALHARGHVIGSHSCSHPARMSSCTWDALMREWRESCKKLSEILGDRITVASVPGGYFSKQVAAAASEAGIEALFTSEPTTRVFKVGKCWVLGRFSVMRGTSTATVLGLASGKSSYRLQQSLFWNLKKVAKLLGGEYYLKIRKGLLRRNPDGAS